MEEVGRFLTIIAVLILSFWFVFLGVRGPRRRATRVPDGRADEPYRIFTRDYDLELKAVDIAEALPGITRDWGNTHLQATPAAWALATDRTRAIVAAHSEFVADQLPKLRIAMGALDPAQVAIALLVDQSGSMRGEPIANVAAVTDLLTRLIGGLGARSEVLGFSTAGWRGGRAFQHWKESGRPKRPGRLCALQHIVYKSAEETVLSQDARDAMVCPDLLRENVDGEAVLWAQSRLDELPVQHRLLLVISDGAPVDDATLSFNGPSILSRHIRKVVPELEAAGLIIGGLGINYRVEAFYPRSEAATELDDLPEAAIRVLERMLGDAAATA
jgi:cobaltochelatase CobT